MKTPARKKRALLITLAVLGLVTGFALNAGRMLVIDEPRTSDVILVLAINILGDWLRDALNPRLR